MAGAVGLGSSPVDKIAERYPGKETQVNGDLEERAVWRRRDSRDAEETTFIPRLEIKPVGLRLDSLLNR